jgi:transcriptional regulator with XRE-family HTH domain
MARYRFSKTIFSELNERLVEAVRGARKKAGLTQVQAAAKLGCRQTFLSKIECGERRLDMVEFIIICGAYGADPCQIIRRINPKRRTDKNF